MVTYISKETIIQTNRGLGLLYGQVHFLQQEANLDHVLDRLQHYAENMESEEEKVMKKAAYLPYHLAYSAHAFSDGNKRTALTATLSFLLPNGYAFPDSISSQEKQDEVARIMKETAEGKHSISFVYRWLKGHLVKTEPG